MIIYQNTKKKFVEDTISGDIDGIVSRAFKQRTGHKVSPSEMNSWQESLVRMGNQLIDGDIPDDAFISIEYRIPNTSKRIDFIITGQDENHAENVIVIELKQWSEAKLTGKDGIVVTRFKHGETETAHPSYQAWSYCALLQNFNETVYQEAINLRPCAYLHNYKEDNVIRHDFYKPYLDKAPVFLKTDTGALRAFIKRYIKYGDEKDTMYRIDNGKIKPSKSLADSLIKMLSGNEEFTMIDDQKIVYENAMFMSQRSSKNVLIVEGGPGTGKSVVAVNLLVKLTQQRQLVQYVTKNAAPRAVYESKLTGLMRKSEISNLFSGSGAYVNSELNDFDALIVDEAHRLNAKSGMFKNLGENQIKEIIKAAKLSVFFIDEDQRVTFSDIGRKEEIVSWAEKDGANIHNFQLNSQFRCNGSDGYLAWLDNVLEIRETANVTLEDIDYDFQIIDSPSTLRDMIFEKNKANNKARIVAGYCWNWVSKKDKDAMDIVIPKHDFAMKWNLATDGNLWIVAPESVNEVGCIHTCQGLELDYIGVIVGDDFVIRNGVVVTDPYQRAKTDASLKGYKTQMKTNPDATLEKTDLIIKNTYRTLMTRGMKGCYVYFTDKETEEFFKDGLSVST
ncbi:MAG: DUF2075 domain-containing protein [Candidatus Melainabacteria bacterium]|nr:DUF2075 domain-containing protein [Candidatus Melainabacteria bacterium]